LQARESAQIVTNDSVRLVKIRGQEKEVMEKCKINIDGTLPRGIGLTKAQVKAAAAFFAARSSARVGVPFREVTVVLQDDSSSCEAHVAIMGVDGATDVITQGYDAIPGEAEGVHGELYVNAEQAVRVAPKRKGWSAAQELLLYVAHGMDHLSGADDHAPADYARMRRRELRWLKEVAGEFGSPRIRTNRRESIRED